MLKTNITTKNNRHKLLTHIYGQGIALTLLISAIFLMDISDGMGTKIIYVLLILTMIFLFLSIKRFFKLFDRYETESALYQDSFEVLENVSLYIIDLEFNYLYMNKSNIKFMDKYYQVHPKVGENVSKYLAAPHMKAFKDNVSAAISLGFKTSKDILKIDGRELYLYTTYSPVRNSRGEIYAICCVTTNITDSVVQKEKFTELIYQDPLTNLFNRRKVFDYYESIQKENKKIWILLFDLDNFKNLNDTYGHAAGDQLLIDFGNLLKSTFPASAIISRWGGDEFLVLASNLSFENLGVIESAIQNAVCSVDTLGVSVSIGETFAADTAGKDISHYIDIADLKMYEQKKLHKGF